LARPLNSANKQYLDDNGNPLAGGKLYFYVAESSTPKATYTDPDGTTPNSNPVILDANGEATIYTGTGLYKIILTDSDDVVRWTEDNYDGNPTTAEDGIDGKSVRYGAGAPGPGDGNDGDFWIRTTTNFIYGPKASGTWPAGVSLVGPAGADGKTILNGTVDPTTEGVNGDFYINTASDTIFGPKAAGVWPAGTSLVGPQGDPGDPGDPGDDGLSILNGSGAPGGGTGVNGDFYIDTAAWEIFGPKAAGAWGSGTSIVGPAGSGGAPGAGGSAIQEVLTGTFGVADTTYTLSETPSAAMEVIAYLGTGRVPQAQGVDYTISGTTITFAAQDTSTESLFVAYRYIP
jgi:hypothetical protein